MVSLAGSCGGGVSRRYQRRWRHTNPNVPSSSRVKALGSGKPPWGGLGLGPKVATCTTEPSMMFAKTSMKPGALVCATNGVVVVPGVILPSPNGAPVKDQPRVAGEDVRSVDVGGSRPAPGW